MPPAGACSPSPGQQGAGPGTAGGPGRHPRRRHRRRRGHAARCSPRANPVGAAARALRHPGLVRRRDHSHSDPSRNLRAARCGRRRARVRPHPGPRRPLRPERPTAPEPAQRTRRSRENESRGPGRGSRGFLISAGILVPPLVISLFVMRSPVQTSPARTRRRPVTPVHRTRREARKPRRPDVPAPAVSQHAWPCPAAGTGPAGRAPGRGLPPRPGYACRAWHIDGRCGS